MLVSIIIPLFNSLHTVRRSIDSSYAQTGDFDIQLIVVDDGSTDGDVNILKKYYPELVLIKQANMGAASARNTGLKSVLGEFVFFLDADDEWLPSKLNSQLYIFKLNPDVVLVSSGINDFFGVKLRRRRFVNRRGGLFNLLCFFNPIATSTVGVRSSIFKIDKLTFPADLKTREDWFLWFLISLRGDFYISKDVTCNRYLQPTSLSNSHVDFPLFRNEVRNIFSRLSKFPEVVKKMETQNISLDDIICFREAVFLSNNGEPWKAKKHIIRCLFRLPIRLLYFQLLRIFLKL